MKINCRLKATRGLLRKEAYVYPEAIDAGRIKANELVEKLEHNSNVTPAMAQAVFCGMTGEVLKNLMLGHSVEVPGFGVFWVDVKGKVRERKSGSKYIDNGRVSITFTPKAELSRQLNEVMLNVVSDRVVGNVSLTDDEAMAVVDRMLERRPWFMRNNFVEETGASPAYAYMVLNRLADKKLLDKQMEGGVCVYGRPGGGTN